MPPRLVAPLMIAIPAAALLAGCGDSASKDGTTGGEPNAAPPVDTSRAPVGASARSCDSHAGDVEALRATGIACDQARRVMHGWQHEPSCSPPADASRSSRLTYSYRCLAARTDRGLAVSCARAGQSIAFVAKP